MTEGIEDLSPPSPGLAAPPSPAVDTGQLPEEKAEEAAGEEEEEAAEEEEEEEGAQGAAGGEPAAAAGAGVVAAATCCVCVEVEHVNNCLHSEKICILPILACLLSLALCTAGLKWVFADKIFEYEPPTHLDPKRIGQDPIVISVDPTLGLTVSLPRTPPATSAATVTPGHTGLPTEEKSTRGPRGAATPAATRTDASVTMKFNAQRPSVPPRTTKDVYGILVPTIFATTSTTTTAKTSSHVTRCSDSQKNYCVNGGECFTLEIMPGSTKFLCRCPNEFTGDRCQNYVMASFYKAEELYQKRILTITGICIALLVVGVMCVVAYCKTKKQRKKLHDRLRQNLRKKRSALAGSARGRQVSNLPLQDLQPVHKCNGTATRAAAQEEAETSCSTSRYASSVPEEATLENICSQRPPPAALPSPGQLSPVSHVSAATPGSPPSEMSAPLSSLAISVPSVALSPSGEEERPLLFPKMRRRSSRDEQKRTSAHYNHGHEAHSSPPSPAGAADGENFLVAVTDTPTQDIKTIDIYKSALANGHALHHVEPSSDKVWRSGPHRPLPATEGAAGPRSDTGRTKPAPPHGSKRPGVV